MTSPGTRDSFKTRTGIETASGKAYFYRLETLAEAGLADLSRLPFSIKVLIETMLRCENGDTVTREDIARLAAYDPRSAGSIEVPFMPARVLLQDFTGVPCVVDLAAMRSAMARLGEDPRRINPRVPVDLVIDHSIQVDACDSPDALEKNVALEFERNRERYELLRWAQGAFTNFRVIPPASGICHQVNLEYLATVVQEHRTGSAVTLSCDSVVGTDSHTTMVNGMGVLGWGVGGIEAEAVMLGRPLFMPAPAVVGVRLAGTLPPGSSAFDLALAVTEILRRKGVVGKFVEFFGPALPQMTVPDRATVANMAPEYGATAGFFPVDERTLDYLRITGRTEEHIERVERYCRAQGLFRSDAAHDSRFEDVVELDLSNIRRSISGPRRPQDRIDLDEAKACWRRTLRSPVESGGYGLDDEAIKTCVQVTPTEGGSAGLSHGSVVIAAITSCTSTSNPSAMLGAGLMAKKAVEAGLRPKPWVKTSLAPGSLAVTEYLKESGLLPCLEKLGFYVVGYGCTTCIGNSGPLLKPIAAAIEDHGLVAASVLSGNRNFEGRINPHTRAGFLASPMLVLAYAIAGTMDIDLAADPLGVGDNGGPVYLKDIWPSREDTAQLEKKVIRPGIFLDGYGGIEKANEDWNSLAAGSSPLFDWQEDSTYIQEPPFFMDMTMDPGPLGPIENARVLVMVRDSVTTDHISPAGAIPPDGPAGEFLLTLGVPEAGFNSYGSRRGNHHVMTRGTFANIRLRNMLAPGTVGGMTTHFPSRGVVTVYEASCRYGAASVPTIILAGRDYGMGSSRDWAAKGVHLLGVRAVIAESFERIHRSNLVGMGVLPLQFEEGQGTESLGLDGSEIFTVHVDPSIAPHRKIRVDAMREDCGKRSFFVLCRLDTPVELEYYRNGGILQTILRRIAKGGM